MPCDAVFHSRALKVHAACFSLQNLNLPAHADHHAGDSSQRAHCSKFHPRAVGKLQNQLIVLTACVFSVWSRPTELRFALDFMPDLGAREALQK
jgi:hypothetical protein